MARRKKTSTKTTDFRHGSAKRTNIPPAKIAGEGKIPAVGKQKYAYSPHLSPVLRFDPEARADKLQEMVNKACSGKSLTEEEKEILRAVGTHWEYPSMEWAGKKEEHDRHWRTVDPVALHIHERVSANAILSAAKRTDVQRSLFADPELEYQQAVQFYEHDMDWANRLILGDSLEVMSSLTHREDLAGKVQMIYVDPPYGIRFASNFQPQVGVREVKEKESDLTREPETVKAYRDAWSLGVHSYISYLRDRLLVSHNLLTESGSVFVQIGDENLHRVRALMDEVFGDKNFCAVISFSKTTGLRSKLLPSRNDFLLWYAKDVESVKFHQPYTSKSLEDGSASSYNWVELSGGLRRGLTAGEKSDLNAIPDDARIYRPSDLTSQGNPRFPFRYRGKEYSATWKTTETGLTRLGRANRLHVARDSLRYVRPLMDFPVMPVSNYWEDTGTGSFTDEKIYVVQTGSKTVQRCMLMTTDPGDLVLDPTCGSGTTAYVAEQWGRRWITVDTSRVAVSLARQRLLTATFDRYRIAGEGPAEMSAGHRPGHDPSANFVYDTVPHVTLASIVRNENLDPIFEKHESLLGERLDELNQAMRDVTDDIRERLTAKLAAKLQGEGLRSATDADRRRWLLPGTTTGHIESAFTGKSRLKPKHVKVHADMVPPDRKFEHWHVPVDTDPDWPKSLSKAVTDYGEAWRAKMAEIDACIFANAEQEVLVHEPEVVPGVVRVTGPFTVEGVMPEELNLGEEGLLGGIPSEELDCAEIGAEGGLEMQNLHAYLDSMVSHLKSDGVTFPDNKNPKFARLESLFDTDSASALHAEGVWEGDEVDGPARVGVGFGPQYGPVTAKQVEELIREASRRGYDELVVAGFSFDAEAHAIIVEDPNPKVRVHMAQIRPDLNPGMDGLLKDTPSSQLFTVFGAPAIRVDQEGEEYTVTLEGVDIYDPVKNTVRSTGATKVAAWFLDSDYNGRTFCIAQAFFPDQDAWGKLAKALKDVVEPEAFAAFKGTTSLPFEAGEHGRIAVKVIDPRGSEVMTIHKLKG